MPVDDEKVKAALDDFEEDKFSDAKEKLSAEIKKAKNAFLKDKLKLKGDIDPEDEPEEKEEDDEKEEKEEEGEKDDKKATKKRVAKAIKKKQDKEEE